MTSKWNALICALLTAGAMSWSSARGQMAANALRETTIRSQAVADIPPTQSRIVAPIDETKMFLLRGNTHPLARPEFDLGRVDPQLPLERMQLVLRRSAEQEAALEKFMEEQQDPKSPNFHHWLTPEEFGKLYGPSDDDIAAVTSWLQNHGFQIYLVTKGRVTIEFSGTAAQVDQTFHTEIHRYLVNGIDHIANDRDPEIPQALAPVITGIASLHNFFPVHESVFGGFVKRDRKTGKITPLDKGSDHISPELTYTDSHNQIHNDVTPYDFATIYNVRPLWNAGIDGTGQTIAISGVSDILQSDIDTFRSSFGLPASTIQQTINGTDPGIVAGATVENTLDVQWSGAVAKNASIVLVVTKTTTTTYGGQLSNSYIVDNKVATVASGSYGSCEAGLGTAGNAALNAIYQQGAAEGISMFDSAGDQGSSGCDNSDATPPSPGKYGLQVNGWASSPYVTAVGGTDFGYYPLQNTSTYWNSTNDPTTGATVKGYIPEVPWDATCTSKWLLAGSTNFSTSYDICAYASYTIAVFGLDRVTGGSGGVSACTTITGGQLSTCSGGYDKPSWQQSLTLPDGKRDVPDVSLFAAGGWEPTKIDGSAYLLCVAANSPAGCDYSDSSYIIYQEVGGTSVSSPAMAGIMALVVQKMGGKAQGLANPTLYSLAAKENFANCDTNSVAKGNNCVFYDVTTGTNAMVCVYGSIDCYTPSGYAIGIVTGYNSATGYDLTTGLGTINAYNLVNAWSSAIAQSPTVSTSGSSNVTSNGASVSGQVNPSGSDTQGWFQYGTSSSLSGASSTTKQDLGSGTSTVAINASLTGLSGNTTYYFRAVASNSAGTVNGSISSFTTSATTQPPTVSTGGSANVTSSGASVSGQVNPSGTDTQGWFQYGTSSTLSGASSTTKQDLGYGTSTVALNASLTGLSGGTTYYFRAVASNSAGTVNGAISSFTTSGTKSASGLQFVAVTPCRVVDTRNATGPFGGPEMGAGTSRTFNIPQSACNIPSTAVAYSLNVTVVPGGALNYLTMWPAGQAQPNVSTLNSDGRVKANAAITPAGTNGGVSIFVSNATNVILDIDGYFVPAGTASALAFYPVTPCRVVDTRTATGPLGGPSLGANSSRAFPVQSSSCGIPSTAKAYSLNVTAIPHSTLNYLTSWPTGETQPNVSTLNSSTGAVTANAAIVPAGTSGEVSIFVSDAADVILDINGYFAPPASGGLSLYTVAPCRVIDTRQIFPPFPGTLTVSVQGSSCSPPSTAAAYVLNATVVPTGSFPYLTLWPAGESQPYVSTLNAYDGVITSNMAIVPTNNGAIDAYSPGPGNLILDISSYFAP